MMLINRNQILTLINYIILFTYFEAVIKAIYLKFQCPPAQCLTELLLSFMLHRCRCFAFVIIDLPPYLNILDVMPEIIIWAKG